MSEASWSDVHSSAIDARRGLDGAVSEVDDDEQVSTDSECALADGVASMGIGDSDGGAGVSRSESPREMTEEAELDTLPVELRLLSDRSEKAAAEDAVEVREEVGGADELG